MSSVTEEIKSRLNIADIVGGYLKLEKAGGNFKARCPFHNERSASFFVSPSRQTYHCFGCNRGGDMFTFVEEIEGVDFSGALKVLAARAGVELKRDRPEAKEAKDEREALYRTLDLAARFYEAVLPRFPEVVAYVHKRGLTDDTVKRFRVGYAPDEWRALGDFLAKKGVAESMMERAGLIVRSEKGYYDRFRGRVMFPIADSSGRVVAFSGRVLSSDPGKTLGASAEAKYVNSPETEVFHKSRILFGFDLAKHAMRERGCAVLVEGQLDLILSHQAGVENTVASSGTALTADHLALIKRFTSTLVLALDADTAGLSATHRAIELALDQDMTVLVAKLPNGMDPADLVLKDKEAWKSATESARQVIDFYLELLPSLHENKDTLRTKVSEIIVPFIARLRNTLDQAHYAGKVAELLRVKEESVWEEAKKYARGISAAGATIGTEPSGVSRRSRIARSAWGIILWQEGAKGLPVDDIATYRARIETLEGGNAPPGDGASELVFEAEMRYGESKDLKREIEELLSSLAEEALRDEFSEKMKQLHDAERRGDTGSVEKLLAECQTISQRLHEQKTHSS